MSVSEVVNANDIVCDIFENHPYNVLLLYDQSGFLLTMVYRYRIKTLRRFLGMGVDPSVCAPQASEDSEQT